MELEPAEGKEGKLPTVLRGEQDRGIEQGQGLGHDPLSSVGGFDDSELIGIVLRRQFPYLVRGDRQGGAAAELIATKLVRNRSKAPIPSVRCKFANEIPALAKGGTKAAAMATPGKAAAASDRLKA